jgi:hypothetical protein
VASDVRKKHAKYLTGISSNAVFIRMLVNTPTKVKHFPGSDGVKALLLLRVGFFFYKNIVFVFVCKLWRTQDDVMSCLPL